MLFALLASRGNAADDERRTSLEEQIRTLEVVVGASANPTEKERLDEKLTRLRRELAILDERQVLDERERQLRSERRERTLDVLREKLRAIDVIPEQVERRLSELATRRRNALDDREDLASAVAAARARATEKTNDREAEIEERLFTRNEELRALALEREAAEAELDLAQQSQQLRGQLKTADAGVSESGLRPLFEAYTRVRQTRKSSDRFRALVEDLESSRAVSEASLELSRQKLARFDEELTLLEKQTGFFVRDPRIERLLATQRSQKAALSERLPFMIRQVAALTDAQTALRQQQELAELSARNDEEHYAAVRSHYLGRLRWPAVLVAALLLLHVLVGYILLPLAFKNEALFMARRIARYIVVVCATGIVAGFLFDDLSMIAATLGIVSAALVISLQDVCTSVFAWFVIMTGEKFRIGDRLEIDGTRGDVLDLQLLRTTLLEVTGTDDQPTGRVILVPNNVLFKTKIFNFTHEHPFIWGKLSVTVAFSTPMAGALVLFQRILEEETRESFEAARSAATKLQRRYGVEDAIYEPHIQTEIVNDGVTLTLLFVAHYRQFSATRNRLNRRIIRELESHPHVQLSVQQIQIVPNTPATAPAAMLGPELTRPPFAFGADSTVADGLRS